MGSCLLQATILLKKFEPLSLLAILFLSYLSKCHLLLIVIFETKRKLISTKSFENYKRSFTLNHECITGNGYVDVFICKKGRMCSTQCILGQVRVRFRTQLMCSLNFNAL